MCSASASSHVKSAIPQSLRPETSRLILGLLDVRRLLTHTFRLSEYRRAFTVGLNKAEHEAVKVTFDFR